MSKPQVFVARRIPENGLEILAEGCSVILHEGNLPPTREELLDGVAGCHGILSLLSDRIDAEVCDAAGGQLRVVSNFAVGYNNIDVAEMKRRNIAVGNTPDVLTDATADIAVALLLSVARRLSEGSRDVRGGRWRTWEPLGWIGLDLVGSLSAASGTAAATPKTLGIVGMGRIGQAVARRLQGGWGMRVLYTSRQPKPSVDAELKARHVELDVLLAESDFISLHVPLNATTNHLIGQRELGLMKPQAILINTARGEVVDQSALVEALRAGRIFGAGLDVCTPEPISTDNPLLELPNCLLVPHIGSATQAARNAMAERAARNVVAGVRGEPLPFPVSA